MPRSIEVRLVDIREAIAKIEQYVHGMDYERFAQDGKTQDAVVRNLEVIGEACKGIPSEFRNNHSHIPWQRISGLRDILIHDYFGIDVEIIWDIVQNKLPELGEQLKSLKG
jgi:uncharacterized protein with HEPN domain